MPITGYAIGQVTENLSFASPSSSIRPYMFTPGELVYVEFSYDLERPNPVVPGSPLIAVSLSTAGGFSLSFPSLPPPSFAVFRGEGENVSFEVARGPTYVGIFGSTIHYSRDLGVPSEGFRGTLTRLAGPIDIQAVPEPSTLALGGIGGLLAMGYARRRKRIAA